uniref:Kinesin-like protein KIF26B n=1 Tax=Castor canadensis TaxID=51338 RepID=A0A8B7W9S3_CASCN|nr:kinesin-like protein KIF26B [Castor canadensis]
MNSLAGNKDRLAVSTRGKKYGVNEVCSPTKPAAPFSPESWYRKAYEESRAGSRPTPEGAGSALGSSGTPSPGSGTSSPSSFTGSPGPASPGIGTSSPGSLGGSPGFGTGSPGSGSGGGSSPGSDRGVWCENCNARLVELKRQALKLLLPGPFPAKVSARAGAGPLPGGGAGSPILQARAPRWPSWGTRAARGIFPHAPRAQPACSAEGAAGQAGAGELAVP